MPPNIRNKTRSLQKCFKNAALLFLLISFLILLALPLVLSTLVKGYLLTQGIETSTLKILHPNTSGLEIKDFSGTMKTNDHAVEFRLSGAKISYPLLNSLLFSPQHKLSAIIDKNLTISSINIELKNPAAEFPILKIESNKNENNKIHIQMDSYTDKLCKEINKIISSTNISCNKNTHLRVESDIEIASKADEPLEEINLSFKSEANGLSIHKDFFPLGLMSANGTTNIKETNNNFLIEKGKLNLRFNREDAEVNKENIFEINSFKSNTSFYRSGSSLLINTEINALEILSPVPISNIFLKLKGKLETKDLKLEIALSEGKGKIFGGNLIGSSDRIFPLDMPSEVLLEVKNLSLHEILALYPTQIEGIGEINGSIPLTLNSDGFSVSNGMLESEKGGTIRYKGKLPGISENQNIQFISEALENYHYDSLDSTLNYLPDGTLNIALALKGKNPELMNGRQINFNLNVEENIPSLLKSLSIAKEITNEVSKAHALKNK